MALYRGSGTDEAGKWKWQFWVGFTLSSWLCNSCSVTVVLVIFVDRDAISETLSDLPKVTQLRATEFVRTSMCLLAQGYCLLQWGVWRRRTRERDRGLESCAPHVGPVAFHLHVRLRVRWRNEGIGCLDDPSGTRGALMANLGSCFASAVDGGRVPVQSS